MPTHIHIDGCNPLDATGRVFAEIEVIEYAEPTRLRIIGPFEPICADDDFAISWLEDELQQQGSYATRVWIER